MILTAARYLSTTPDLLSTRQNGDPLTMQPWTWLLQGLVMVGWRNQDACNYPLNTLDCEDYGTHP